MIIATLAQYEIPRSTIYYCKLQKSTHVQIDLILDECHKNLSNGIKNKQTNKHKTPPNKHCTTVIRFQKGWEFQLLERGVKESRFQRSQTDPFGYITEPYQKVLFLIEEHHVGLESYGIFGKGSKILAHRLYNKYSIHSGFYC